MKAGEYITYIPIDHDHWVGLIKEIYSENTAHVVWVNLKNNDWVTRKKYYDKSCNEEDDQYNLGNFVRPATQKEIESYQKAEQEKVIDRL